MDFEGKTPFWRFGKTASFGVFAQSLKDGKLLVLLYKGVIFVRQRDVTYYIAHSLTGSTGSTSTGSSSSTATTTSTGSSGSTTTDTASSATAPVFQVKNGLLNGILITEPVAGAFAEDEFPLYVFYDVAAEKVVVSSSDSLKTFKALTEIDEEDFYTIAEEKSASQHTIEKVTALLENAYLPDNFYGNSYNNDSSELLPICYVNVSRTGTGELCLEEVLDMHERTFVNYVQSSTALNETGAEDDDEEDECNDAGGNGVGGGAGAGAGGGGGGVAANGAGGGDAGGAGVAACPNADKGEDGTSNDVKNENDSTSVEPQADSSSAASSSESVEGDAERWKRLSRLIS